MKWLATVAVLSTAAGVTATPFNAGGAKGDTNPTTPAAQPPAQVTRMEVQNPPRQVTRKIRFRPWAKPNPRQVDQIINVEAQKWGAPASRLRCRINGESSYEWWQNTGGHLGLGQFLPETFHRGMSTIKTRKVKMVRTKTRTTHSLIIQHWSDGRVTYKRGSKFKQRVRAVYKGMIPIWPPTTHGWAQVRIMAQAMVGRSAVSDGEWQVRC